MSITHSLYTPQRTGDGSLTLRHTEVGELFHSRHGAVSESAHVFLRAGLEACGRERVDLLEVGLGTGLNMLLTWIHCLEGKCAVRYTALEPRPLDAEVLRTLGHCDELGRPDLSGAYIRLMTGLEGEKFAEDGGFAFLRRSTPVQNFGEEHGFDVVYFDAFAPMRQPEMWTPEVFQRMYRALRPGGLLVTYCAKGSVRRTMQAAGFTVERLPGPPGKREMLRARKPGPGLLSA